MRTALTFKEIEKRATKFFTMQGYSKQKTEISEYELTYQNGKDVNYFLIIMAGIFLIIFIHILLALLAVILLYIFSPKNEVMVILREEVSATEVTATGNSLRAQSTADNFLRQLPQG
jgi:hypothetical protein